MTTEQKIEKKGFRVTINTKILIVLLALSIILLAFSAYTAFNNMAILGNYVVTKQTELRDFAVDNGIKALRKQTEEHLLTVAKDQASISNVFFGEIESQVNRLVDSAEHIWQNPSVFDQAFPYYSPMEHPEQPENAVGYNLAPNVSFESVKPELDRLSYLNRSFLSAQSTNANVYSVYVGTQSGITLYIPWYEDDTLEFEPRERPWYKRAVEAGKLVWTDPYLDSDIDALVMTCARPFYTARRELVGVIGVDITLTMLVQGIISTQVGEGACFKLTDSSFQELKKDRVPDAVLDSLKCLEDLEFTTKNELLAAVENQIGKEQTLKYKELILKHAGEGGFAFLMKANGGILASPTMSKWDEEHQQGMDNYFKTANLLQSSSEELVIAAKAMTQGEPGITPTSFEGQDIYIAYAPVPLTGWSLGVVMPVDKVIAPAIQIRDEITTEAKKTEQEIQKRRASVRTTMGSIFVVMIFVVIGISYTLSRRITKPILELHHGVNTLGSGDLDYTIEVRTGDELEDLANAFNKMTGDLKKYIHDLEVTTAAKKKFETELEIGRQIQRSLLPQTLPQIEGWEIVGSFEPAREVAGDFYDIFLLEESEMIFFVVADVCDKGVGPAMFAAVIRTLLRAFSANYSHVDLSTPEAFLPLSRTNDFVVVNQGETNMFATVFAGVLDPQTGRIRYVNCGHNPPYIITADLKIRAALKATGPVLGPMPGVKYKVKEETLQPGEVLFVYTDGLPEARGPDRSFFTDERVQEIITQPASSAAEILDRMVKRVQAHISTADQYDDITLTIIQRKN